MEKHRTSILPLATIEEERLLEPVEQLGRRNDADPPYRWAADDGSAMLTDLQRVALRWLAFFD